MRRPAALGLLLVAALGCGGIWDEVMAESYSEMTLDLEQAIPASDPNLAAAQEVVADGWIAAWEGRVGFWDTVGFSVAVDEALADGVIEPGEVLLLRQKGDIFEPLVTDPAERAELLEIKATFDNRLRATR